MKRLLGSVALGMVALSACTGASDQTTPSPSGGAAPAAATVACTADTATSARQVKVSTAGFDHICVTAVAGTQFFFVSDSDKAVSFKTTNGSPESLQVDLPNRTSTYARSFKKKGTYVIEQAGGRVPLTLLVR